jgi:thioredoxin reductase
MPFFEQRGQEHGMSEHYETIVVGGGPAGLSAALVLGRCLRRVLVCDSGRYRNERSRALHCFMSRDGIPPSELLARTREELGPYGSIAQTRAVVSGIDQAGEGFTVRTEAGASLGCRSVLVATGVVDHLPAIEGMQEFFGRSVHVCPYCDGWEHRGAPIAVFGEGGKGASLALLLRQWTHDLVLCTHGTAIAGEELERLTAHGIPVREQVIRKLEGADGCLSSIVFADGTRLARSALFFDTGQHPRSALLEKLGCRYAEKGVAAGENGETSVPGVYVAGDVSRDVQLAIIAAAEGARAALAINRWLLSRDGVL